MKKKPFRRLLDEERKRQCPDCGSTADTYVIRNLGNLVRAFLNCIIWLVPGLIVGIPPGYEVHDYISVARRCRRCGAVFAGGRIVSRRLDECVRCGYSLIGNVSGVCPECGWKLRRAHKRFVRSRGTGTRDQPGFSDKAKTSPEPSTPALGRPERQRPANMP